MSERQPDSHPVIHQFLQDFLKARSRSIWRVGRSGFNNEIESEYISLKALEEQLSLPRVEQLLKALFKNQNKAAPNASLVRQHYLRSFAVLLCIGAGEIIDQFTNEQTLRDQRLPFEDEPSSFPPCTGRELFADFKIAQRAFCPHRLEFDGASNLGEHDILPINDQVKIDEGGSAVVWKIVVDEEYDGLVPQEASLTLGNCKRENQHTYVVKTYRGAEAQKYYNTEKDAFRRLQWNGRPPANIIEYYGCFVRGSRYSIILEYANMITLHHYLETHHPPQNAEDVITFWQQFLGIIHGLLQIHGQDESKEKLQIFHGWHQDIDPSNILVVHQGGRSVYDCDFKISDLGLSHFKKHDSSSGSNTDRERFGTRVYGSPETRRSDDNLRRCKLKVRQDDDIWSLGCVISEVTAWVNGGWPKVIEYRKRRVAEMAEKTGEREDCFHNGYAILPCVQQTHTDIEETRRIHDYITPLVVQKLLPKMLLIGIEGQGAKCLYEDAQAIIKDARRLSHSRHQNQQTNPQREVPPLHTHEAAHQPHAPTSGRLPEMSVETGRRYMAPQSNGSRDSFTNQDLFRTLDRRDHAFLIDNSKSMEPYRRQVKRHLELLSYMLIRSDPDGVELYFTTDETKLKSKGVNSLLQRFDDRPNFGTPDMRERFASLTESYQERFGKRNYTAKIFHPKTTQWKGPRPLRLYVLTNGVWQPKTTLKTEVETLVKHLVANKLTNKQIGIQFIRFGQDPEGIQRLDKLDSMMNLELDVVDHTPADGNVWKMLLGSINESYDDDDTED